MARKRKEKSWSEKLNQAGYGSSNNLSQNQRSLTKEGKAKANSNKSKSGEKVKSAYKNTGINPYSPPSSVSSGSTAARAATTGSNKRNAEKNKVYTSHVTDKFKNKVNPTHSNINTKDININPYGKFTKENTTNNYRVNVVKNEEEVDKNKNENNTVKSETIDKVMKNVKNPYGKFTKENTTGNTANIEENKKITSNVNKGPKAPINKAVKQIREENKRPKDILNPYDYSATANTKGTINEVSKAGIKNTKEAVKAREARADALVFKSSEEKQKEVQSQINKTGIKVNYEPSEKVLNLYRSGKEKDAQALMQKEYSKAYSKELAKIAAKGKAIKTDGSNAGAYYDKNPVTAILKSGGNQSQAFNAMSEDEKNMAYAVLATQGRDAAAKYLENYRSTAVFEKAGQDYKQFQESNPNVLDYALKAVKGGFNRAMEGTAQMASKMGGNDNILDSGASVMESNLYNQYLNGFVDKNGNVIKYDTDEKGNLTEKGKEELEKNKNKVGAFAYAAAENIGSMVPTIAMGMAGGGTIGLGTMFTSAYGNSYKDQIGNGVDVDTADKYATRDALSEVLTEKFLGGLPIVGNAGGSFSKHILKGLGKVSSNLAENKVIRELIKGTIDEGMEEWIQAGVLSPLNDRFTLGDKNAKIDLLSPEALESALLGSVVGGIFGTVGSTRVIKTRNSVESNVNNLVNMSRNSNIIEGITNAKELADNIKLSGIEESIGAKEGTFRELYSKTELSNIFGKENASEYMSETDSIKDISAPEKAKNKISEYRQAIRDVRAYKEGKINNEGISSDTNSIVKRDVSEHTREETTKRLIRYENSADVNFNNYISEVMNGRVENASYRVSPSSEETRRDINSLTGIDTQNAEFTMRPSFLKEIVNADNGIENSDIAKLNYILNDYDSIERGDNPSYGVTPLVIKKTVGDSIYTAEVIPDNTAGSKGLSVVNLSKEVRETKPVLERENLTAEESIETLEKQGDVDNKELLKVIKAQQKQIEDLNRKLDKNYEKEEQNLEDNNINNKFLNLSKNFINNVKKVLHKKYPSSDMLRVFKHTPDILLDNNVDDLPVLIPQSIIKNCEDSGLKEVGHNEHRITVETLLESLDDLNKTSEVYQYHKIKKEDGTYTKYGENHFAFFVDKKDSKNRPIMIAMTINKNGRYLGIDIKSNNVNTAFGVSGFNNYIENRLKSGEFTKLTKKGETNLPKGERGQFPNRNKKNASPVNNIISQNGELDTKKNKNLINDTTEAERFFDENNKEIRQQKGYDEELFSEKGQEFNEENAEKYKVPIDYIDSINEISKKVGVEVRFRRLQAKDTGNVIEGMYKNGVIYLDPESKIKINTIFKHELTHYLKNGSKGEYERLEKFVLRSIYSNTEAREALESRIDLYMKEVEGFSREDAKEEVLSDFVSEYLFTDKENDMVIKLAREETSLFTRIRDFFKMLKNTFVKYKGSREARTAGKVQNRIIKAEQMYKRIYDNVVKNGVDTDIEEHVKYHVSRNFESDIETIINNLSKEKKSLIKARDFTPRILVEAGMPNYPMYMGRKHIFTTILTKQQAKQIGFPVNQRYHYHGLGKKGLIDVIDSMDNPKDVYRYIDNSGARYDSNNFIIDTGLVDKNNSPIIVTAKIVPEESKIIVDDYNMITSAYGKNNFSTFINTLINKGYVEKINNKERVTTGNSTPVVNAPLVDPNSNSSKDIISQKPIKKERVVSTKQTEPSKGSQIVVNSNSSNNIIPQNKKNDTEKHKLSYANEALAEEIPNSFEIAKSRAGKVTFKKLPLKKDLDNMATKQSVMGADKILSKQKGAKHQIAALKQNLINDGYAVEKLGKSLRNERMKNYYNSVLHAGKAAEFNIGKYQVNHEGKRVGKSLREIFEPIRDSSDFTYYMLHRLNIDRWKTNKPIDEKTSREKSEMMIKRYEASHPEYIKAAKEVYNYIKNEMQYKVDSGLIDKATKDYLEELYPNYIPVEQIDPYGFRGTKTRHRLSINKPIKEAEGFSGFENITDIDKALVRMTMGTTKNAKINMLLSEFYKEAKKGLTKGEVDIRKVEDISIEDLSDMYDDNLTVLDPGEVVFYDNGKKVTLGVNNPMLFESLTRLNSYKNSSVFDNIFADGLNKAMNVFKKSVTAWDPTFAIRNFFKDIGDALLYAPDFKAFVKQYPTAVKEIVKGIWGGGSELWDLYQSQGGLQETYWGDDSFDIKDRKGIKAGLKVFDLVEQANVLIEQAPRFTEFIDQVRKGGTSYENLTKAMYRADDITVNFNRGGKVVKIANRYFVPFFNPAVQGGDKLIRSLLEQPNGKALAGFMFKGISLGISVMAMNGLIKFIQDRDEDEEEKKKRDKAYSQLNDYVKNSYYLFYMGDGKYLRIPKGRAVSAIGILTNDIYRKAAKGEDVSFLSSEGTFGQMWEQISPLPSGTLISPITDAMNNKNYYGGQLVSDSMQKRKPSEQYDENTDVISKKIGQITNISPKKINYVLKQYSGVGGRLLLPFATPSGLVGKDNAVEGTFKNLTKSFISDTAYSNNISSKYYDVLNDLDQRISAEYDKGNKTYTPAKVVKWYVSNVSEDLNALYGKKKAVLEEDLTNAEKVMKQRKIQLKINKLQEESTQNILKVEEELNKIYKKKVKKDKEARLYSTDLAKALYKTVGGEKGGKEAIRVLNYKDDEATKHSVKMKKSGVSYKKQAKYYIYYNDIKYKKSKYTGWKKEQLIKKAKTLDIPVSAQMMLIYSTATGFGSNYSIRNEFGYGRDESRNKVYNYLIENKSLSKKEKIKMFEYMGYEVVKENGKYYACW
ncbi:phage minor structural protein, N-terminal domain protein [Anaerofustis stercorihominis DSM 17244]|uniref:Phage minor structural protein, N-terminal domain protein n=1 Tax=Anaerofustis stercorihominis DSM 17244 TaxID=445971 RepID=B1C7M6_9FIRM|nr:LPD38 domain-containing protein [Anaerofustis stercorihominis]EDS73013.1 phage minor structural protein, N-terminal domain protein [Anaerofustis stercorihominis DSM 17244]